MAQNFWIAIFAWLTCFVVTMLASLATAPKPSSELRGLVYGLTEMPDQADEPWYRRPGTLAMIALAAVAVLNIIFW
jgi:SSS family solute:Na+ symporter